MATITNLQAQSIELKSVLDFSNPENKIQWMVINDGVMGGLSRGSFERLQDFGRFEGDISLDNNGGFSSVRFSVKEDLNSATFFRLKIKGDGKDYQLRIKVRSTDYYSYIHYFSTSGEWEEIYIPIDQMYASFRGRRLNLPNFSEASIQELTLLIGNKRREKFNLNIESISLVE